MAAIRPVADRAGVFMATRSHVINDTRAIRAPLTRPRLQRHSLQHGVVAAPRSSLLEQFAARRVDGLPCTSLAMSAEQIAPVLPWRRPEVVFERTMPNVNVDALEIDSF